MELNEPLRCDELAFASAERSDGVFSIDWKSKSRFGDEKAEDSKNTLRIKDRFCVSKAKNRASTDDALCSVQLFMRIADDGT